VASPPAQGVAAPVPQPASRQIELPMEQPGLAHDPTGMRLEEGEAEQMLPSTRHPSSSTFAMPRVPGLDPSEAEEPLSPGERRGGSEQDEPEEDEGPDEPGHPVGRWLARLIGGFAKKRAEGDAEPPERASADWRDRPPAAASRRESAPSPGSHE